MGSARIPRIALVWTQFAVHHSERVVAAAQRLQGKAEVLGVEIASTSRVYADFGSAPVSGGASKVTLYNGRSYDDLSLWLRIKGLLPVLMRSRMVCFGVPYSEPEVVLLGWILRLMGKKVILLCDSKFDDRPRFAAFEFCKRIGLSCFTGALFASRRSREYLHFLGFHRRPLLPGSDGMDVDRMRSALSAAPDTAFASRDFVFVGRFVREKSLPLIIAAYARYAESAGKAARRLVLVGAGPLEAELRQQVADLGLTEKVVFTGFLSGSALADRLVSALGLILASNTEQWGLVVNEATAAGLPVIASEAPGARDLLVRNLISGYVVPTGSLEGLAAAMSELGRDPIRWNAMREASLARSRLGDVSHFVDSIELLFDPGAETARQRIEAYCEEL